MATAQNVELYRGVLVVILVNKGGQDDGDHVGIII